MDGWDVVLLVGAGYVAVMSLVRLMMHRRNQLVDEFRKQLRTAKVDKAREQPKQEQPAEPIKKAA